MEYKTNMEYETNINYNSRRSMRQMNDNMANQSALWLSLLPWLQNRL